MSGASIAGSVAAVLCAIFAMLAGWHVRMAFGRATTHAAVPGVDGKPLFVPSRRATLLVALVLAGCAALVATTAGFLPRWPSPRVLVAASAVLAIGLLARAVGDFRYVGFFKRVRGSPFAVRDTVVYSPLCLALAIGVAAVAIAAAP